jgi:hypothetical protein
VEDEAVGDEARTRRRREERGTGASDDGAFARGKYLLAAYVIVSVAGLIVLRALVDGLDFLGVGWILVLAALPLLPWLVPRLAEFVAAVSPYVETVSLGGLRLELRRFRREPISVPSSGTLAALPNDFAALSSSTAIMELLSALRELRRKGAGPIAVIDLRDGRKWRLPNLYFVARLLALDPIVSQLVLTEMRGGTDGYFLATCRPDELRDQIEQTVPAFATAARSLMLPADLDLANMAHLQTVATAFTTLTSQLPAWDPRDDDPVHGYVTSAWVRRLAPGAIGTVAIDATTPTLDPEDVATVLDSSYRYVPATTAGLLAGLVDRDAVALEVARAVRARDHG